jgi:hypothetical protein
LVSEPSQVTDWFTWMAMQRGLYCPACVPLGKLMVRCAFLERYRNDSTKLPGTWECEVSALARLVDSRPAAMTTVGQFVGCLLSTRS